MALRHLDPMACAIVFAMIGLGAATSASIYGKSSCTTGFVGSHAKTFSLTNARLSSCKSSRLANLGSRIVSPFRNQRSVPAVTKKDLRMTLAAEATELEKAGEVRDLSTADCNPRYGETGGAMLLMSGVTVQRYEFCKISCTQMSLKQLECSDRTVSDKFQLNEPSWTD